LQVALKKEKKKENVPELCHFDWMILIGNLIEECFPNKSSLKE
jgi:hypothetical protein